jgi:archaemetzincin
MSLSPEPAVFHVEVFSCRSQPVPEYAFNKRRSQYFSSQILDTLVQIKKLQSTKILVLIDKDLYVPELNFVFGVADVLQVVCIISLTRLRQSYYNLPEDNNLFMERALKEAVHEMGHLLGHRHCTNPKCVMHFSNSLQDTDIKGCQFCGACKKLIP